MRYQCKSIISAILVVGALLSHSILVQAGEAKFFYQRLGGYGVVSAVVDDFASKLFDDSVVGARFFGMSDDSRQKFLQKNKNRACKVTGSPCKVISRPTSVNHRGFGIKVSEIAIVAQNLVDTLYQFNVPQSEHEEPLAMIETLRLDIFAVGNSKSAVLIVTSKAHAISGPDCYLRSDS